MVSDEAIASRTEFLDDYYGLTDDSAGQKRFESIDAAIRKRSTALVIADFQRTLDQIKLTLAAAEMSFSQLFFRAARNPTPRYFQVVFLAFYTLIVKQNYGVSNRAGLVTAMNNLGDSFEIQEGGRWGAENRETSIDQVTGVIQKFFGPSKNADPALVHWITQLENLLSQSYTEQASYDFKQGFTLLDGSKKFDENSLDKVLKTCVAIANIGKGHTGYVLVGVAENAATAAKVEEHYGASAISHNSFHIVGVDHEAHALGKSSDEFFQIITDKISKSKVSDPLRSFLTSHLKSVRYYDKTIYVFETRGQEQPSLYGDKFFLRVGNQVKEVATSDFSTFFQAYNS